MPTPPLTEELLREALAAFEQHGSKTLAAEALGIPRQTFQHRIRAAAERGLMGTKPVLPGFRISQTTAVLGADGEVQREFVQQKPEHGAEFEIPAGHKIKGVSALVDADGRQIVKWVKTGEDEAVRAATMRAAIEGFKDEIPRAALVAAPVATIADLLCQYTITDVHLAALAWHEETRGDDYDLTIGEHLLVDWFRAAIAGAPPARRAVFAQMGDFLHYDSFKSVTPEHGNLLDSDTRFPKMVRVAIRVLRVIIRMLLEKHEQVEIIMCDANHDPAGEVWLREMFAVLLEDEPRATVDTSPSTYTCIEHGLVSLFYHHGHRRGVKDVDSVFASTFREVFGRTKHSYAHLGHKHQDELKSTNLMKVEQHETLAAPDAFSANGGWRSGRSAKVLTYHSKYGEVGRQVISAGMVADLVSRAE
jgi:hypothetical protein